jgi:ribosome-associated protein
MVILAKTKKQFDPQTISNDIARIASEKKANDIVIIEVGKLSTIADFFVVLSGATDRQTRGLSKSIVDELKDKGVKPQKVHGETSGNWVVIDYGSVVVHIFREEERQFYRLERLWKDAPSTEVS